MEQQDETVDVPNADTKEKAPCLETIYKRLKESNGAIQAIFYDLDYITRTTPPNVESNEEMSEKQDITTPNLMTLQTEVDILRNRIRDCKKKLDKARWG